MKVTQDTVLWFGKYRGKTAKELLRLNPQYLQWASSTIPDFELEEGLEETVIEAVSELSRILEDDAYEP